MESPITVAIIDDHDVIHAGIEAWCAQAAPPIQTIGNYTSAAQFEAAQQAGAAPPDVVILDLELTSRHPDFASVEQLSSSGHRVIVYSHLVHDEVILRCLDLGAVTYIAKAEGKNHLLDAIRAAADEQAHIGPRMAGAMSANDSTNRPRLSQRELDVLTAWFQTESKDLVAKKLFITPATVRTHLHRIRAKYAAAGRDAPTKAALVARAIQDGIVSVDDL
ncbi:response regulator transcription factor [Mycobacterium sp. CVI_P3]|uniref:Response regulator transcription factor n=2 Tax=Mycobacterium pinniadriaticum TaxID=2994102 RepID=A0ABT3SPF9_9MYCO|nr:response regulator transcription factor [Mycobacterium pinniadriaticum]MCX2934993.1 response regulator transcription factor [Mycobacterium pinniadriaticum]MCX2941415.1 response regulator transcription factor [Mycobacterium pinniadriaticum]